MCYIVLRSGKDLVDAATRDETRRQQEQAGYVVDYSDDWNDESRRYGPQISVVSPPAPKPNFTFKLKIMLSFLQIITNLDLLQITWPTGFRTFLSWFNPANLDFVQLSRVNCVVSTNYYHKLWTFCLIPPILVAGVLLFYTLPQYIRSIRNSTENDRQLAQKIIRKKTWKLFFFILFLIYPSVSSFVLRLYVCRSIEGVSYLQADYGILCDTSTYRVNAVFNAFMVILYPIGVPALMFYMLWRYRHRLEEAGVRAELGFLYDAFERRFWYFEFIDMLHKILITSIVAFFPSAWQMPFCLAVAGAYLLVILLTRPYVRKGDDRLQQLAQTEVIVLLLAAYAYAQARYSSDTDAALSTLLIALLVGFMTFFGLQCYLVLRKMFTKWGIIPAKLQPDGAHDQIAGNQVELPEINRNINVNDLASKEGEAAASIEKKRHSLIDSSTVASDSI